MGFEFATATEVVFGRGSFESLGARVRSLGRRALVVTGSKPGRTGVRERLEEAGVDVTPFRITAEPTTAVASEGAGRAREADCAVVVGVGGGSVLDGAKAISALLTNGGEPLDYLEVIGAGRKIERPSAPFVAVPTTSGTGSEVTRNAVLASPEHRVKVSLRSVLMLPRVALLDPALTRTVPPDVTASTGLDALTQVLEPFVSSRANPLTDVLCRDGLARAARSLRRAYEDGADLDAREDMALVSLYGGMALANAGLGAVHGFAGPLGGRLGAPHGALCARLLPGVITANVGALRQRATGSPVLGRYAEVARILTGRPDAAPEAAAAWVGDLAEALKIPGLAAHGLTPADIPAAVAQSREASSMRGNPIELADPELHRILEDAL
ncbi:MAG: iron-containing alcohol dehydrogenase [Acidobacteria bacterium]|nr:iron-containing alcohol dehydrogenase [Acidobacteriota bacterium]